MIWKKNFWLGACYGINIYRTSLRINIKWCIILTFTKFMLHILKAPDWIQNPKPLLWRGRCHQRYVGLHKRWLPEPLLGRHRHCFLDQGRKSVHWGGSLLEMGSHLQICPGPVNRARRMSSTEDRNNKAELHRIISWVNTRKKWAVQSGCIWGSLLDDLYKFNLKLSLQWRS